jgi:hypothetical protein
MGNYKKHISSLGHGISSLRHKIMSDKNSVRTAKGQAAMEFLVTYGWAILLILVIMAILYSSIFKPEFFVAERCDIGPGIACDSFYLNITNGNQLNFTLKAHNTIGFKVNITQINFTLQDRSTGKKYEKTVTDSKIVGDQEQFNYSVLFTNIDPPPTPGVLYNIYFTISFKNNEIANPPMHTTAGIINVRSS